MGRLKRKESEFIIQAETVIENANTGILAAAGISTASWNAVETSLNGSKTAITVAANAKAQAEAAVDGKNTVIKALRSGLQSAVDKFYATPSITNEDLKNMGLPPRSEGSLPAPPITVVDLVAQPLANGGCKLKWKRTGNRPATIFEVQSQIDGVWTIIGTTLEAKYTDQTAAPAVPKSYRIVSRNIRGTSNPSQVVTIYSQAESVNLKLAA